MKSVPPLVAVLLALVAGQAVSAATASSGTATASRTKTVEIVNFAFRPATLNVGRGTKVVFSNTSNRTHTATRSGGFDKRIKSGRSASVRFERRGTFRYHCKIHPQMRGKVIVG